MPNSKGFVEVAVRNVQTEGDEHGNSANQKADFLPGYIGLSFIKVAKTRRPAASQSRQPGTSGLDMRRESEKRIIIMYAS